MRRFILSLFALSSILFAQPEVIFSEANKAYRTGAYSDALAKYQEIIGGGYQSPEIYYNSGNCYFRLGQTGRAILQYERALRLAPNDADIRHNHAFVRTFLEDKIEAVPQFFLFRWFELALGLFSADGWFILMLVFFFSSALLFILFIFSGTVSARRRYAVAGGSLFAFLFFSAFLFSARLIRDGAEDSAILVEKVVNVKYSPENSAKNAFILHEGTKVKIVEDVDNWMQIRIEDGKTGWVVKTALEII